MKEQVKDRYFLEKININIKKASKLGAGAIVGIIIPIIVVIALIAFVIFHFKKKNKKDVNDSNSSIKEFKIPDGIKH